MNKPTMNEQKQKLEKQIKKLIDNQAVTDENIIELMRINDDKEIDELLNKAFISSLGVRHNLKNIVKKLGSKQ